MIDSFFIPRKLSLWDKATIVTYIILSLGAWYYFDNTDSNKARRDILFTYVLGTHLFLYLFNYRSLRNLTVYIFWLLVGFAHLFIYFQLKDDTGLRNVRGHAATGFRNVIILLLLFQVLRFASIKFQKKELVAPSKSQTDLFDERHVTFIDFIFFVIYLVSSVLLLFN